MPNQSSTPRIVTVVVTFFIAIGASACLVGKSEDTKYSGRYIGEETLKQIEAGDSQDEVASLLGEPTSRTQKSAGTAVWKYSYSKATTKSGAVFLLFGSSSTTQTEGAVYVEFDSSRMVVKTWSER